MCFVNLGLHDLSLRHRKVFGLGGSISRFGRRIAGCSLDCCSGGGLGDALGTGSGRGGSRGGLLGDRRGVLLLLRLLEFLRNFFLVFFLFLENSLFPSPSWFAKVAV